MRVGRYADFIQFKDGFILAMCKDFKILNSKLLLLHVPIISK